MLLSPGVNMSFNIGERNVARAQMTLKALSFKIAAQEVGGNAGRTVRLYVVDGRMTVRVLGNQEREI
jgi:chemotaxis protein CheD